MRPSKCVYVTLPLMLWGILSTSHLRAQTNPIYPIEANIVYHFTKYIDWPKKDESGDFVIGVIGNSPVVDEMVKLMGQRSVGSKKITIRQIQSNSPNLNYQIIFITEEAHSALKTIVTATVTSPILIVCEGSGLVRKGAAIDLVLSDDHLKLEINKTNIERHKLQIASELLQLATVVN